MRFLLASKAFYASLVRQIEALLIEPFRTFWQRPKLVPEMR